MPANDTGEDVAYVLEHPRLPFISYPYEWTFEQLRDAALLHVDLHIKCLEKGVTLSDATAYNIQFDGWKPVFIDRLSLVPYEDGMLWHGQKQFVEQFVTPLLIQAYAGIPFNEWYMGQMDGIPIEYVRGVLPFRRKLSFSYMNFVGLPATLEKKFRNRREDVARKISSHKLPREAFILMLRQLCKWVSSLPAPRAATFWTDYTAFRTYANDEVKKKLAFIAHAVNITKARTVWDIGCNTGEFSEHALQSGARFAVGFEADHGALAGAYAAARTRKLPFLPLYMNVCRPSPSLGWNQTERDGLRERANADLILGLAVLHHMVIGGNIPLEQALDFFIDLSPAGVIEWVPREDQMVKNMLALRRDIFIDYDLNRFRKHLQSRCRVLAEETVSSSGRTLFLYERIGRS